MWKLVGSGHQLGERRERIGSSVRALAWNLRNSTRGAKSPDTLIWPQSHQRRELPNPLPDDFPAGYGGVFFVFVAEDQAAVLQRVWADLAGADVAGVGGYLG